MTGDDSGPARLCVTNAKGGTGKTTIAINVAGALNQRGHDVLFVDIDPQGNATEGLGLLESYDAAPPTLFDVLTDADERANVGNLIVEHELTLADAIAHLESRGETASIGALEELTLNVRADNLEGGHALDVLSKALAPVEHGYDYINVDSLPFYGKLTDASIYATGNVLVPALTESTSERAIELLMQQVTALEDHVDIRVNTVGVVANRVEQTNEDEMMIEWLNEVYPDTPVWEVRKRVALQRAFSAGNSIFEYEQSVDVAFLFDDIAASLDRQFDRPMVKQ